MNQPKYKFMNQILKPLDRMKYFPFDEHDSVIAPDKTLPNSLMIFDDIACKKEDSVWNFILVNLMRELRNYL